ncbi:hypothetical protein BKA70DRAFT_1433342 [Coprinopsis sp. MPI-PUGE-AT-0042]|nr:hypothetical protein BKA70DRAFT_1433342 [Coprinopsis sp. MPI-PUGE-AT-0042]
MKLLDVHDDDHGWRLSGPPTTPTTSTVMPMTKRRKNGLFKKAYELGVLCSVDVAVIIFEERPGHHVKLYQYCSTDIHDIVGRHMKHDGEKDTKGPNDFSGGNGGKAGDDMGDGEDDEAEDDDEVAPRSSNKRSRGESSRSGLKLPNDMNDDYHPRGVPNLQHPSGLTLQAPNSSLPISTVRTSSGSSIGPPSSSSSAYNPSSNPIASSRSGSGSHRTHRTSHPSRSPPETHTPVSAGYTYHGTCSSQFTPPGGYVGLPGDYPRGGGPPAAGGGGGRRGFGASFGEGGGGGGMYSHTGGGGGGGLHPRSRSGDAGGGPEGNGVFDFLDGNSRGGSNPNSTPGFGLEWPVGSGPGSGGAASGGGPPPPPPAASSTNA